MVPSPVPSGGFTVLRSLLLVAAAVALVFPDTSRGDDKAKEVKVTGTLVCAHCKLKMEGIKGCTNALQVKDGDKTVTYLLEDKAEGEDYHVCGGGEKKDVTVTGVPSEKDGQKWIKPTKVDVKK
jgi:hypothetical protein